MPINGEYDPMTGEYYHSGRWWESSEEFEEAANDAADTRRKAMIEDKLLNS